MALNLTTDSAPSNYPTPWGPILRDGYNFSGFYRPHLPEGLHFRMAEGLDDRVIAFLERKGDIPAPTDQHMIYYAESCFRIVVTFVMEGGAILYSECATAVNAFADIMTENQTLNTHPTQVEISKDGQTKLDIASIADALLEIRVNAHQTLSIHGVYWPLRQIPLNDVQHLINDAIESARQAGGPDEWIGHWAFRMSHEQARFFMFVDGQGPRQGLFNYGNLIQLLQSVNRFYSNRRTGLDLRGDILRDEECVGVFVLQPNTFFSGNTIHNGTINGNNSESAPMDNGVIDFGGCSMRNTTSISTRAVRKAS